MTVSGLWNQDWPTRATPTGRKRETGKTKQSSDENIHARSHQVLPISTLGQQGEKNVSLRERERRSVASANRSPRTAVIKSSENTVRLRRGWGYLNKKNFPVLGSVPLKRGSENPPQKSKEKKTRKAGTGTRIDSEPGLANQSNQQAEKGKRRPARADPTSLPQELELDARGRQRTTVPFLL